MLGFGRKKQLESKVAELENQLESIKNESVDSSQILKGSNLWEALTGGASSASGAVVNEKTAMAVAAVYACVGLIGGAIASLPLPVYERNKDGRTRLDHDLWWLLNEEPHDIWSAPVFWEFLLQSLLLRGDSYAQIHRRKGSRFAGDIVGFEPHHPSIVTVKRLSNRLVYIIDPVEGDKYALDQDDVLHIPGLGFNGLNGMSQIAGVLRNAAGNAIATEEYTGKFFKNGARPDYALETEQKLDKTQVDIIRNAVEEMHGGYSKSFKPGVFTNGIKVKPITMKAEDAQLIQTRGFQVLQVCMAFGVPPHMIGYTEKSSSWGTGVEQLSLGLSKYTLRRHLTKIETEINRKCFLTKKHFCEFNLAGLEAGDYKTRMEGYRIALGRAGEEPWIDVEEIRRLENLPPRKNLKTIPKPETE